MPPEAPTDPDVRTSRIRLLKAGIRCYVVAPALLSAGVALRCIDTELDVSFHLSLLRFLLPRLPLPSSGSARDAFPRLSGTMESSDFLPPSRRLRFLRWRLPGPLTCSLIRYGGAEPYRGLAFTGGLRNSLATTGPPRFLGDPFVHMTTTFHPAGPPRQAIGPLSVISPTHSWGFCLRLLKRPRP